MIRVETYEWGHEGLVRDSEGRLVDGWVANQADDSGGVSVKFKVHNYGDKPVRKYSLYFSPSNGAFETVCCTVRNQSVRGVNSADQVNPYCSDEGLFKNAWYNHSIRHVSLEKIEVQYTDFSTQVCEGNYEPSEEEKAHQNEIDTKNFWSAIGCLAILAIPVIILLIWLLSL